MHPFRLLLVLGLFGLVRLSAQEATLTTDTRALSGAAELVTLTATVSYPAQTGAVGWEIQAPEGAEFVVVGGANTPEIQPAANATGLLEFAYTSVPARSASFTVTLRLPAGLEAAKFAARVILRQDSKRSDLKPAPIVLKKS
jgi:hypothetical protein